MCLKRNKYRILIFSLFFATSFQPLILGAAIRIVGNVETEIFYILNQPPSVERFPFEVIYDDTNYLIKYTDSKNRVMQLGTDSGDLFSIEYMQGAGGYERGFVENGPFPSLFPRNLGQILWLGFFSDSLFIDSNKHYLNKIPLRIFAAARDLDQNGLIITNTVEAEGGKLLNAVFYFPGTYKKNDEQISLAAPYNEGYLVGKFVATFSQKNGLLTKPTEFDFFTYLPVSEPKNKDDVRIFEHFNFKIVSIDGQFSIDSFLPKITTSKIAISDKRLLASGKPVGYGAGNKIWVRRKTGDFAQLRNQAAESAPLNESNSKLRIKILILLSAFMATAVLLVLFIRKQSADK